MWYVITKLKVSESTMRAMLRHHAIIFFFKKQEGRSPTDYIILKREREKYVTSVKQNFKKQKRSKKI